MSSSGIWEGFIPNLDKGTLYKYKSDLKNGGLLPKKAVHLPLPEKENHPATVSLGFGYHGT
jgi:1,4-alpha-glucan branching enzyme